MYSKFSFREVYRRIFGLQLKFYSSYDFEIEFSQAGASEVSYIKT